MVPGRASLLWFPIACSLFSQPRASQGLRIPPGYQALRSIWQSSVPTTKSIPPYSSGFPQPCPGVYSNYGISHTSRSLHLSGGEIVLLTLLHTFSEDVPGLGKVTERRLCGCCSMSIRDWKLSSLQTATGLPNTWYLILNLTTEFSQSQGLVR